MSVSSGSVASGGTITVTLYARDAYGNSETTGGQAVAFRLGGTSGGKGTFSRTTDNHNGTYTATFTGTIAGANTITATIAQAKLTTTAPAITVTPGAASVTQSLVSVPPGTVSVGGSVTVTFQAKDARGNNLTHGGLAVAFVLASTGGGQGTFGMVEDKGDGTYTVTFSASKAGGNLLEGKIDGQVGLSKPARLTIRG